MAKLVEDVYGSALFELACEEDRIDAFLEDVNGVLDAMRENSGINTLLTHPQIPGEEKQRIVEELFLGRISDEITGFIKMVVEKGHFAKMNDIFETFIARVKEYRKIGTAYVSTPIKLKKKQRKALEEKLLDTSDFKTLEMHYSVDESLIGGMVVRIGDQIVDSSVKTKLERLTQELSAVRVGE